MPPQPGGAAAAADTGAPNPSSRQVTVTRRPGRSWAMPIRPSRAAAAISAWAAAPSTRSVSPPGRVVPRQRSRRCASSGARPETCTMSTSRLAAKATERSRSARGPAS